MPSEIETVALDIVGFGDSSVGTDQIADPPWDSRLEILLALLTTRIVGAAHGLVGIGQEWIGKALAFGELLLVCHRIEGNAENDRVGRLEGFSLLTEPVALDRSTRGRSLGVPPHCDPLPLEPRQTDRVAILIGRRECGRINSH
jgi:hypothetical protein